MEEVSAHSLTGGENDYHLTLHLPCLFLSPIYHAKMVAVKFEILVFMGLASKGEKSRTKPSTSNIALSLPFYTLCLSCEDKYLMRRLNLGDGDDAFLR